MNYNEITVIGCIRIIKLQELVNAARMAWFTEGKEIYGSKLSMLLYAFALDLIVHDIFGLYSWVSEL